ncbi:hypothetical protein TKK_0016587 [Trichogramma kaykai]
MAHKKKNADNLDNTESAKKPKTITLTQSSTINNFQIGNKSIIVKAFVDDIRPEENHINKNTGKGFTVWKFIINNNDGLKIQCTVYNELIDKFKSKLTVNKIYLFQNLQVMHKKNYTRGNSSFEFLIKFNTIEYIGDFNKKSISPKKIRFHDLPHKPGLIAINGFLRTSFIQNSQSKETEYVSSVTDGKYKLDVLLQTSNIPAFDRGSHVEIIGELEKKDPSYILVVANESNIKLIDAEIMDMDDLIEGNLDIFNE